MPDPSHTERVLADAARTLDRRDAELLLAAASGRTRTQLLVQDTPLPAEVLERFRQLCARRAAGESVAYLLGRREFWSLDFDVGPAVLVPRPETELLVERALALVTAPAARVADLGTGSGAIAIALAHERPTWRLVATDASDTALAIARRNGEKLAPGRVDWRLNPSWTDWFAPLAGERFDALVSNPPYIAGDDPVLAGDGLKHEPRTALTPEGDGYAALLTLINGSPGHLEPGGWLVLEHGESQAEPLRAALVARGFTHVTSHRDLAGRERITEGLFPNDRF